MFNNDLNVISLRRKNKLILQTDNIEIDEITNARNKQLVFALMKELENLGYILDEKLYYYLLNSKENDLKNIHNFLIKNISELKGKVDYKPFYPNFPKQVEDLDNLTLYFNAIVHYWLMGSGYRNLKQT